MIAICHLCMQNFEPLPGKEKEFFKDCPICSNPLEVRYTLADEIIAQCNKGLPVHDLDKILKKHWADLALTRDAYQSLRESIMRWHRENK